MLDQSVTSPKAARSLLDRDHRRSTIERMTAFARLLAGLALAAFAAAASRCGLSTGFMRQWGPKHARETKPWTYSSAPHVGATAWYLMAAQGRNPFALAAQPWRE